VSHPPDKINGINISDHFRRVATCLPQSIPGFADSVYPEAYFKNLKQFIAENNDYEKVLARTGIQDFVKIFQQMYPNRNFSKIPVLQKWEHFARHDAMVESVSDYLFENASYDLFATYFRFPDIIQHFVTHFMDKEFKQGLIDAFKTDSVTQTMRDEAIGQISDLLEPAYGYMERIIKKYVENEKNENTYFFIMSDHGFSLYPGGFNHYGLPEGYEAPDGFLMIHGPRVKPGMIKKAGVFDIAPTILYLMDLPVGKNMDGRVLREIFKFNRKLQYKPYKLTHRGIMKRDDAYDKEAMEELKSIGYVD
jgi:predicted AlkP superfamily phosphohydrolase/phosphomutase